MERKKNERLYRFIQRIHAKIHTMLLAPCFYKTGRKISIMPPFHFANLAAVELGSHATIHPNCWILTVTTGLPENGPKLIIGDHSGVGMNSTISAAYSIIIEKNVTIAPNVYISDHGHEYRDVRLPVSDQGIRKSTEVRIGEGSWIGHGVTVLPGATIGKNCVIGANSVVNSAIADYCIAVGCPAKVIRRYDEKLRRWEKS